MDTAPDFTLEPVRWPSDYCLIDSGDGKKLERFGSWTLIRPEPQALWSPNLPTSEWNRLADGEYLPQGSHNGRWLPRNPRLPANWTVGYRSDRLNLRFRLALTAFKHVGLFPEQAANWEFIAAQCRLVRSPQVLNLFAYTGGASLAAAQAGAQVVHLDAVRQVVGWAKANAELNGLDQLRWLVDDALKFVRRETRRNRHYTGILLDPPAYGHGPGGERWVLEEHLPELVGLLGPLLDPAGHFVVLNSYSLGYSPVILAGLLAGICPPGGHVSCGELLLPETSGGRHLPAGVFARLVARPHMEPSGSPTE
jgi:23S rRNA (cytosine1962-C5)-methyltransferase